MNTPPLLLGLVLLFWGWQTGHLAIGAAMAALVESPRVVKARWSFSQADLDRLWNICALLFFGTMIYLFFNEGSISLNDFFVDAGRRPEAIQEKGRAALLWIQWFPMLVFPIVIAVAFSDEQRVEVSTFSWFYRKYRGREGHEPMRVTIGFPYLALILFATAASNQRTPWFYVGASLVIAVALWSQRVRREPVIVWALLFGAAAAGGFFGHVGLHGLQRSIEGMNLSFLSKFVGGPVDMRITKTAMGSVGELKLSDRIVLRVRTDGQSPPTLLREASYNRYTNTLWLNMQPGFKGIIPETNNTTWILHTNAMRRSVTIGQYLRRGSGLLAAPLGAARIDDLPVGELEKNGLGALRVKSGMGLVLYTVRYDETNPYDAPPQIEDKRELDEAEPVIATVAQQLGLYRGMEAREAMRIVAGYFASQFSYSSYVTKQHRATRRDTVLARFFKERTGHCEYFATATALLLRHAGVPTRYAVGYAVQEGSGKKYIVRERHAHAWTLVWDGSTWRDFDTTPGGWNAIEKQHSSWLRPVKDLFSNLWFEFSRWRWSSTDIRKYLIWIPAPLLVVALISFVWRKQWRNRKPVVREERVRRNWPGLDSEIYEVERALAARGLERRSHESWRAWLDRIDEHAADGAALRRLISLHSKYRFDPDGLDARERDALRDSARSYLKELKRR